MTESIPEGLMWCPLSRPTITTTYHNVILPKNYISATALLPSRDTPSTHKNSAHIQQHYSTNENPHRVMSFASRSKTPSSQRSQKKTSLLQVVIFHIVVKATKKLHCNQRRWWQLSGGSVCASLLKSTMSKYRQSDFEIFLMFLVISRSTRLLLRVRKVDGTRTYVLCASPCLISNLFLRIALLLASKLSLVPILVSYYPQPDTL